MEFLNLKLLLKLFKRILRMKKSQDPIYIHHKTQSTYITRPNPYTPQDPIHVHDIKIYYKTSLISSITIN
jgi:hypothetical protein